MNTIEKITAADYGDLGIRALPDVPSLASGAMQRKFDELALDLLIPKHNALVQQLCSPDGAHSVGYGQGSVKDALDCRPEAGQVLTKGSAVPFFPTEDYDPATKKYVDDKMVSAGLGDMLASVYDPDGDGIVAVAQGGTGASTASGALAALGGAAADGTGAMGVWNIGVTGSAGSLDVGDVGSDKQGVCFENGLPVAVHSHSVELYSGSLGTQGVTADWQSVRNLAHDADILQGIVVIGRVTSTTASTSVFIPAEAVTEDIVPGSNTGGQYLYQLDNDSSGKYISFYVSSRGLKVAGLSSGATVTRVIAVY